MSQNTIKSYIGYLDDAFLIHESIKQQACVFSYSSGPLLRQAPPPSFTREEKAELWDAVIIWGRRAGKNGKEE